jgi:hypothetical protein
MVNCMTSVPDVGTARGFSMRFEAKADSSDRIYSGQRKQILDR